MSLLMVGSFLLVLASSVCYHLTQKSLSTAASPFSLLTVTYGVAFCICLAAERMLPSETGIIASVRTHGFAIILLSLAVVGIESGILMTYRAGWNIGVLPMFVNASVTLMLIPLGILLYREHVGLTHVLGIFFIVAGLCFLGQK